MNSEGKTILEKSFGERRKDASWTWAWNGRNRNGSVVPKGKYKVRVLSVNDGGQRESEKGVIANTKRVKRFGTDVARGGSAVFSYGSGCVGQEDDGWAQLICIDGGYARAVFRLQAPVKAIIDRAFIKFVEICCWTGKFEVMWGKGSSPGSYIGTVEVGGSRTISISSFVLKYHWFDTI